MSKRRVVITGLGVVSSIGKSVPEFWDNLINSRGGIGPIEAVDISLLRFHNGAEVKNFKPEEMMPGKDLDLVDRYAQFTLAAAREAVADAAVEWSDELRLRTAVITGTSIGGVNSQERSYVDLYRDNKSRVHPFTIPRTMPSSSASHVSMDIGIYGPAYTISTACASSNHAMGNAFWMIRSGLCDMALAGGSETPFTYTFLKAWEAIRVVAPDTCRPFSKNRQGMILGEGGGMIVMEALESAQQRNAKIYAEIVGFGMSSDASHITKPDQHGAIRAIKMALEDGAVPKEQVDYVNAHGTATLINDAMETGAIKSVFGNYSAKLSVSSTKSLHGHVLGGTSALEAVATSLALKNQIAPPTANYTEPDPECDLDIVPNQSKPREIRYAISNSFAFGGLNAVLAFKNWEN